MESTLIACTHSIFSKLKYQVVLRNEGEEVKLNNINIIVNNKIILKIREKDTEIDFDIENIELIVQEILIKRISTQNKSSKSKVRINKSARKSASENLMNAINNK